MLTLEEYISNRINKEEIDIYDLTHKQEHMKACIDFVFEYFNDYLDESVIDRSLKKEGKKLQKYRESISKYDVEIQNWLVNVYKVHNTRFDIKIRNCLKKDLLFPLYSTEKEFNKLSYKVYTELYKKDPWIEDNINQMNLFIKNYHELNNQFEESDIEGIRNDNITKWIISTYKKYNVNLYRFVNDYLMWFTSADTVWDKYEVNEFFNYSSYDFIKSKNKFDIKGIYFKVKDMPFMKNRKRDLELLMFYIYCDSYDKIPDTYAIKYLSEMGINNE